MNNFPNKDPDEKVTLTFDFAPQIVSEPILQAVVEIAVVKGTDSNPTAMLIGGPVISGQSVLQSVSGGVVDVDYELTCRITTASEILELAGRLRVRNSA